MSQHRSVEHEHETNYKRGLIKLTVLVSVAVTVACLTVPYWSF